MKLPKRPAVRCGVCSQMQHAYEPRLKRTGCADCGRAALYRWAGRCARCEAARRGWTLEHMQQHLADVDPDPPPGYKLGAV
jgi:hypothetical protein